MAGEKETSLECRFYEAPFPELEDLVMVKVKSIAEMGAYVTLLEYNGTEGMILLSELSRSRIRSINKLIRVGQQKVVAVLRVDDDKGYIDLSKRRVSQEDVQKCEEKFNKSKRVHNIMCYVAKQLHIDLEEVNKKLAWPLYKKYGHAYDAFKASILDSSVFDQLDAPEDMKKSAINQIKRCLTPQPIKIRADVEVTCFAYEGIDGIRSALKAAASVSTAEVEIDVHLIAPPLYVFETSTLSKAKGVEALNKAIAVAKEDIAKFSGDVTVKEAPRTVSEREDRELSTLMEELARTNKEVSGDDDHDEEEDA